MRRVHIGTILLAALLILAFAGCGGGGTPAPATQPTHPEQTTVLLELTPNYNVTEGLRVMETIQDIDFDIRLPKVTHSKNPEIATWYNDKLEWQTGYLAKCRSGEIDLNEWEWQMSLTPVLDYTVRQAKSLVCVQIDYGFMYMGLVFDNDGTIYGNKQVFALYDLTEEEAYSAIVEQEGQDYGGEIIGCMIYDEQTLYCDAVTGGDLGHGWLITKRNGVVTAAGI